MNGQLHIELATIHQRELLADAEVARTVRSVRRNRRGRRRGGKDATRPAAG